MSDIWSEVPDWQQTAILMQPALIRVIDHLRHALDASDWQGTYDTFQSWPEETSPELQAIVNDLIAEMESADDARYEAIAQQLEQLPQPIQVYILHLEKENQKASINVWELCYQVSLAAYQPQLARPDFVELPLATLVPDKTLLADNGEVDWTLLDQKAAKVVALAFQNIAS